MQKKNCTILFISLLSFCIYSQSYKDDTLVIRAILDANGLSNESVSSVTDSSDGRVTTLNLDKKNISILSGDIGKLNKLTFLTLNFNSLTSIPSEIGNLVDLTVLL